ncbi:MULTISPECIES: hypothetical protein [Streptomyces]|uniref:Uncharacterized protein n=1 Tax=Streptomyces luteosporeus TaxID=173856 RepID=A0ABN3TK32_9ACTN
MNRVRRIVVTLSVSTLLTLACTAVAAPAQAQGNAIGQAAQGVRQAVGQTVASVGGMVAQAARGIG